MAHNDRINNGSITTDSSTSQVVCQTGLLSVLAQGTFGGATVKLQVLGYGGNWYDVTDASYTANVMATIDLGARFDVRLTASGTTGTTSIYWEIRTAARNSGR